MGVRSLGRGDWILCQLTGNSHSAPDVIQIEDEDFASGSKTVGYAVKDWPRDVISGALKIAYENWERDNIKPPDEPPDAACFAGGARLEATGQTFGLRCGRRIASMARWSSRIGLHGCLRAGSIS